MIKHAFAAALLMLAIVGGAKAPPYVRTEAAASEEGPYVGRTFRSAGQAAPHRIVSLVPAVTEMLFAMGAGDSVVGVSSYDHYPPAVESRTRVGALVDPDFERILSLRPDLVVVYGTQDELIARLTRAGLPLYRYAHAGLADILVTLRTVGGRVGRGDAAGRIAAGIDRDLSDIRRRVAGRPKPKTLTIFAREDGTLRGIYANGGAGFIHDMLDIAGGTDVFADIAKESVQASTELILARAPEVIIEVRVGITWTPDRLARERAVWRALSSVPAVRTDRIYIVTEELLPVPGPRVAEATRLLAKLLHPDAFKGSEEFSTAGVSGRMTFDPRCGKLLRPPP